ncbi:hypothetical protein TRIATDRAFT_47590 [Trichoderma atroviride IMI 206040]|uniref:Zn(2)-C6 fungal-type domain-containing protein n=1 Tax=Hypocrea atroviridis (strain ATCC 20476 / IMI 206040) TaxID=452589 RepID=G9NM70_HYPAI|nr:uncharacterized protein TRIATDRAFT_47590 [Trichoderma atroviride IMI 206040]EHK48002.1 hypothetical protein TRIATDRAFT_47590 [Trichoderma atroviride IMI 206040]
MASSSSQRRVKTGTHLTCRKRHLKCDEHRPECKRCEKAGRSCFFSEGPRPNSLDGTALGNSEYFVFPEDHVWVNVPSSAMSTPVGSLIEALNSTLPIYLPQPREVVKDPEQARLLTLYTDHLSGWLALNDPRHHFSASVPLLAMKCPMLLDAIFAFSARYLSRSDPNFNPLLADEYHYSSCASESALALSTVILRMHEMLGDHNAEGDLQSHLRGSLSLFNHNANKFGPGSLKHTAFWTYVRQEILTALRGCCPTNIDTSDRTYYVVFDGDSDDDWTNNIIWITARVVNHYFGTDVSTTASEHHNMLIKLVDDWRRGLPNTFGPLSIIVTDDNSFPAINYPCIWHSKLFYLIHILKLG